jgi:hypothetical protein
VILFTTSDRFDALADAVIELTGPTARDPGGATDEPAPQQPVQEPPEESAPIGAAVPAPVEPARTPHTASARGRGRDRTSRRRGRA